MIFIAVLNYTTSYITVDFILIIKSHRIRKAVFALQIKAISNRFQKIKSQIGAAYLFSHGKPLLL